MGEKYLIGSEMIQDMKDKISTIWRRMLTAQSRQKSYANKHRRQLEFNVGDLVYLKVSPLKGVMRFGKKGKLSPRFVGPFEIKEVVGPVAYKVELPPTLSGVHYVFHVSTSRKHVHDPRHIVDFEPLQVQDDLKYEELPVQILDHNEQ
jgi:ribosomal protein L21E